MTPEEKAVIEAAIAYAWAPEANERRRRLPALGDAVGALIYSCPQCNSGGHVCPGDGNPIGHTQTDCGEHE